MAPTVSKKRSSIRVKSRPSASTNSVYTPPAHRANAEISDSLISSKKDKRIIKHSAFVNKVAKAHKKPLKRRRPSKKLSSTLEGLADALPDTENDGIGGLRSSGKIDAVNIRQKSLKSRPGALKRRERLERIEKDRFTKNMAQLAQGSSQVAATGGGDMQSEERSSVVVGNKWAALRGFIAQTMEQNPGFAKKSES